MIPPVVVPEPPTSADVHALLAEHLTDMHATSPAESVHALGLDALLRPGVIFCTARDEAGLLLGCGALTELTAGPGTGISGTGVSAGHGELKSMRTARAARGRGVASAVLTELLAHARERRYARVSLETGTQDYFAAARRLYARHGFAECGPFGTYREDPYSVFMTLPLAS